MMSNSDMPVNHRYSTAPSPAKPRFISMKGELTDSLQSLPLHLLADRTEVVPRSAATGSHHRLCTPATAQTIGHDILAVSVA